MQLLRTYAIIEHVHHAPLSTLKFIDIKASSSFHEKWREKKGNGYYDVFASSSSLHSLVDMIESLSIRQQFQRNDILFFRLLLCLSNNFFYTFFLLIYF